VKRRFEVHVETPSLLYVDDYAHHPTEIQATLSTARNLFPHHRILAVFQPHLYTRTRDFYPGFAEALSIADELILCPIYPARELPIPGITSEIILKNAKSTSKQILPLNQVIEVVDAQVKNSKVPTLVITLGAGDIDTIVDLLKTKLLTRTTV